MDTQRLIIVSNRQPYEHRWQRDQLVCTRTDNGLTAALDPVLCRHGGTWVAWGSGSADHDIHAWVDGCLHDAFVAAQT